MNLCRGIHPGEKKSPQMSHFVKRPICSSKLLHLRKVAELFFFLPWGIFCRNVQQGISYFKPRLYAILPGTKRLGSAYPCQQNIFNREALDCVSTINTSILFGSFSISPANLSCKPATQYYLKPPLNSSMSQTIFKVLLRRT